MWTAIPAIVFSTFYFRHKHWLMNNVLGIAFAVQVSRGVS